MKIIDLDALSYFKDQLISNDNAYYNDNAFTIPSNSYSSSTLNLSSTINTGGVNVGWKLEWSDFNTQYATSPWKKILDAHREGKRVYIKIWNQLNKAIDDRPQVYDVVYTYVPLDINVLTTNSQASNGFCIYASFEITITPPGNTVPEKWRVTLHGSASSTYNPMISVDCVKVY